MPRRESSGRKAKLDLEFPCASTIGWNAAGSRVPASHGIVYSASSSSACAGTRIRSGAFASSKVSFFRAKSIRNTSSIARTCSLACGSSFSMPRVARYDVRILALAQLVPSLGPGLGFVMHRFGLGMNAGAIAVRHAVKGVVEGVEHPRDVPQRRSL